MDPHIPPIWCDPELVVANVFASELANQEGRIAMRILILEIANGKCMTSTRLPRDTNLHVPSIQPDSHGINGRYIRIEPFVSLGSQRHDLKACQDPRLPTCSRPESFSDALLGL